MHKRIRLVIALVTALSLTATAQAAIKDNDSSCDIALLPAATLLLPYFEVDLESPPGYGPTTIFTVTNVTNLPQAARLTLWTDLAYPVISFNIYLTGYDVQSINLRDLIGGGYLAWDDGTGSDVSPVGDLSGPDNRRDWDNPVLDESTCVDQVVLLPQTYIASIRQAFTEGSTRAMGNIRACDKIGSKHTNAVGYATIDVVGSCAFTLPKDAAYFANEIRWDNVLIGDYMQISGKDRVAQAGPMVHIRAIPEGGSRRRGKRIIRCTASSCHARSMAATSIPIIPVSTPASHSPRSSPRDGSREARHGMRRTSRSGVKGANGLTTAPRSHKTE